MKRFVNRNASDYATRFCSNRNELMSQDRNKRSGMKAGNDVGTVMKHTGHKTLESFQTTFIRPVEGRIVSMQALDNVDGILTAQGSIDGVRSDQSVNKRSRKLLQNKQVAV